MYRNNARLTLFLLTLCFGVAAYATTAGSTYLQVSSVAPEHTEIRWEGAQFQVNSAFVDGEQLSSVDVDGERILSREGYPALPHITRIYRIPNTGSVELLINNAEYTIQDNFNPVPVRREDANGWGAPLKSPAVYGVDEWYPPVVAEMSAPAIFRDFRVVTVTLYPVQVNTVTRQARFYDNLSVDIVANETPGENEILRSRRPSGQWAPLYQSLIENLDEDALDDVDYNPGSYAIICRDNVNSLQWADSLANWRRRMGFTVTIEARNNWTASNVRTYLQNSYSNFDPPLEYAVIIGDVDGTFGIPTDGTKYDHNFADLEGNDDYEEISVGRISAQSAGDLAKIHNKIMLYERTPYMGDTSWYTRAFLYAGTSNNVSSNEILMLWANDMFRNYTGVGFSQVSTHSGGVSNSLIGERLTEGVSYFLWRGTVVGEMQQSAASSMESSPMLPVVLTITCGSGDYNVENECISEAWLRAGSQASPKGGICCVATATFSTHVPFNNTFAGGLVYNIANVGVRHVGTAVSGAKVELLRSFPNDQTGANFTWWNNLMGDPAISMWTDIPVVMDVTYPSTVNVGTRRIRPQVVDNVTDEPIADALVVLIKDGETFAKGYTDAGGFVDIPVTVNTPGTMSLTVSKRNHKPYLADITCVQSAEMVTVQSYAVDDDNAGGTVGNANGQLNPGETVDLSVTLRNFGDAGTATGVNAMMTCDNPDVTVVSASSSFANMSPGQQATGAQAFRISLAPTMLHEESAKLTLQVTSVNGTTHSTIELIIQAGSAIYVSSQVTGGNNNGRLDPGEVANLRITVRNEGGLAMDNVSATLISRYSLLSVNDGTGSFGNIAINGNATSGATDFVVRANSVGYPGSFGNMVVVLQTPNGFIDSVAFALPIGIAAATDPTGPDPYGYYAYDNIDEDYEFHRPYEWMNINQVGIGTRLVHASADPGEQPPNGQTNSDVIELPFDFMFYGVAYDTVTICSNGWAAFGNQDHLDMFRNYPIPGEQAPEAMLAPFWDDLKTNGTGDGVYYYYDEENNRVIVQWNAAGAFAAGTPLDFQLILLDPAHYPTNDGNGIIVFQYEHAQSVTQDFYDEVAKETVGIQAPRSLVGLQCRFAQVNAPGCNGIGNGRTITITTETRYATGQIVGTITDAETGNPLEGVIVSLDGEEDQATTNALGQYTMIDVEIGTYTVRARRFGYNDAVTANFVVEMDSTETASFSLTHPEITLSTEAMIFNMPGSPTEQTFDIDNDGNGPLDFQIRIEYDAEGDEQGDWARISQIGVSQTTGDAQILGCAFDGDRWVASGGSGPSGPNYLYYYDLQGNLIGTIEQPTTTQFGYYDLASDGQFIYGSTDGLHELQGIDYWGTIRTTIPVSQVSPARCIAYDPVLDQFWVSDYSTAIYCIDRDGNEIHRFENTLFKSGLAWYSDDIDGYKLYVFHVTPQGGTLISKVHPSNGALMAVEEIVGLAGDRAGGCDITSNWNSMLTVFGGVYQNPQGDRLEMRQMKFDTDWIGITPLNQTVLPQSSRDISVSVNPANLRDLTYHVNIVIENNSLENSVVLPLTLVRTLVAEEPGAPLPQQFALHQNYPNPFNPSTQVKFDLMEPGFTSLRIYNVLGQEVVAPLSNQRLEVGSHLINVDMSGLPSGVYLYRLESGSFVETKKMVLMK